MIENIEVLLAHLKAELAVLEARIKTAVHLSKQPQAPVAQDNQQPAKVETPAA
jgi:hypothetical protein